MAETSPDPSDRLFSAFRRLIQATFPSLKFFAAWEYVVQGVASDGSTLDAKCSDPSAAMPDIKACPIRPGVPGLVSLPALGSTCTVVFANGDPTRYKVIAFDQSPAQANAATPAAARTGDAVNAGYLVVDSTGKWNTPIALNYFPATAAGLTAATNAAAALIPPGAVLPLTLGVITGGSAKVTIG